MEHKPTYTTILHDKRKALGLTLNEYCIADSIDKLSNTAKYQWCETSREEIGAFIGISKRAVITIIKKLEVLGLVEINEFTGKTRTTHKWTVAVNLGGEETSPVVQKVHQDGEETSPSAVKKLHQGGEETSPNNINNIYINKHNRRDSIYASVTYLENLPQVDIEDFYNTYSASRKQITEKGMQFANYCLAKGVTYKDYRRALMNALLKDFGMRVKNQLHVAPAEVPFVPIPEEKMAEFRRQKNELIRRSSIQN